MFESYTKAISFRRFKKSCRWLNASTNPDRCSRIIGKDIDTRCVARNCELWNLLPDTVVSEEENERFEVRVRKLEALQYQVKKRYEMAPIGGRTYGKAFFHAEIKALLEI